jgi:signal transduction histidine kinase
MADGFVPDNTKQPLILLVDDEEDARRLLEALLARKNYRFGEASDGKEVLTAVERETPDLILLDVMMPVMSGLEVLQKLREKYQTAELPIILLTALGSSSDVVRGLELGANDYLTKPFNSAELDARVRTQLRLKRLHDEYRAGMDRMRRLDVTKDKFLQITAHDLKSPLGTIMMGLQILRDATPAAGTIISEYDRVVSMMSFAASAMQAIIDDYLDLETIKAGQLRLSRQHVSLNQQVTSTAEQYRAYADSKGINLAFDLDGNLPSWSGDPDRLNQVIGNLLSNAIKFSPRGTAVKVRTLRRNGALRLEVSDQGPGIPQHDLPQLFQEFARLTNKPTGGEKSSGVGLAISRYLVEAHGGKIGVETNVGKGSLFWIELPLEVKQKAS